MATVYLTLEECKRYLRQESKIVEVVNTDENTFKITNFGYKNGFQVKFTSSDTLPSPLNASTDYFVVNADYSNNTFQVALMPNGTALKLDSEGTGIIEVWTSKDDDFIEEIENAVASEIKNGSMGFDFESTSRTEKYYNQETNIFLKTRPLTAITSITDIDSGDVWDSDDYHFSNNGIITSENGNFGNVIVVYTAGFDGLPNELKLVAKKMVALEYKESESNLLVKSSEQTTNSGNTFRNPLAIRQEFEAVLQKYRVGGLGFGG